MEKHFLNVDDNIVKPESNSYIILVPGCSTIVKEINGNNIIIEALPLWIKCIDTLPEPYEYVLVSCIKEGNEPSPISIARCYKGTWEMLNLCDQQNAIACGDLTWFMDESEITHWMKIPRPPKN